MLIGIPWPTGAATGRCSFAAIGAVALLTGACSAGGDLGNIVGLAAPKPLAEASQNSPNSQTEMLKALEYWGKRHKQQPSNIKSALNYARNLKAAGHKKKAFGVLRSVSLLHGDNKELASEYGRLALEFGQVQTAKKLLRIADNAMEPDWRVISARGTVEAKQGNFEKAVAYFERALMLKPDHPSLLNNLAMAYVAKGQAARAEQHLRRAAASSNNKKIAQNLALVLSLQGKHDESRTLAMKVAPQTAVANAAYLRRMVKATPIPAPDSWTSTTKLAQTNAPVPVAKRAAMPARTVVELKRSPAPSGSNGSPATLRSSAGTNAVGLPPGSWSDMAVR